MQNPHFGSKNKIPKIMSKSVLQVIYSCSVQKTAPKNTQYSRNETILKMGDHAKAIAHAKSSLCVKTSNSKTHVKIRSTNHLKLFCGKNRLKKHSIFKKWDNFENRRSCKGYSPCKIITLGQKLKFKTTCQNPFFKAFRVVLCKKSLQKNTQYSRNETILKIRYHAKAMYSPCKIFTLGQKLKFKKTCQNPFYKSFRVVLCKKPLQKPLNIREMRQF